MIQIKNYLISLYQTIVDSIAFIPSVISILAILLAILTLVAENYGATQYLQDAAPFLVIDNAGTARSMLSTLIGGLISLTVFSFSMVMILLNQASSNYSPRLLPALISNKRHQIVLGFYLGSIIYSILILIAIRTDGGGDQLPGFSVFIAIGLGILCLFQFVYFIHSISKEIQINYILKRVFKQTKKLLMQSEKNQQTDQPNIPDFQGWKKIVSGDSGYYQGHALTNLMDIAKQHQMAIYILPSEGSFVHEGVPVVQTEHDLSQEACQEVLSCLTLTDQASVRNNYLLGFKQIVEIAVKAMSPGINDPGTAINAIDYLTELFTFRMKLQDIEVVTEDNDELPLYLSTIPFSQLLGNAMAALRQYCKHDYVVVKRLIQMLSYLMDQQSQQENYPHALKAELDILMEDIAHSIDNQTDLNRLKITQ